MAAPPTRTWKDRLQLESEIPIEVYIFFFSEYATVFMRSFFENPHKDDDEHSYDLSLTYKICALVQMGLNILCCLICYIRERCLLNRVVVEGSVVALLTDVQSYFIFIPYGVILITTLISLMTSKDVFCLVQLFIDLFGYGYVIWLWKFYMHINKNITLSNAIGICILYIFFVLILVPSNIYHDTELGKHQTLLYIYSVTEVILLFEILHLVVDSMREVGNEAVEQSRNSSSAHVALTEATRGRSGSRLTSGKSDAIVSDAAASRAFSPSFDAAASRAFSPSFDAAASRTFSPSFDATSSKAATKSSDRVGKEDKSPLHDRLLSKDKNEGNIDIV